MSGRLEGKRSQLGKALSDIAVAVLVYSFEAHSFKMPKDDAAKAEKKARKEAKRAEAAAVAANAPTLAVDADLVEDTVMGDATKSVGEKVRPTHCVLALSELLRRDYLRRPQRKFWLLFLSQKYVYTVCNRLSRTFAHAVTLTSL